MLDSTDFANAAARSSGGKRPSLYSLVIEARKTRANPTGIIDPINKNFLYWDVFLSRDFKMSQLLAEEIKNLFPQGAPKALRIKRWDWDKLIKPEEKLFDENKPFVNTLFMKVMCSAGFKPTREPSETAAWRSRKHDVAFINPENGQPVDYATANSMAKVLQSELVAKTYGEKGRRVLAALRFAS